MLVKKELAEIPIQAFPKIARKELNRCHYASAAEIYDLKRSGRVLVVDIFVADTRALKLRFFSDGKSYIVCRNWEKKEWSQGNPKTLLSYNTMASTHLDDEFVCNFLTLGKRSWKYGNTTSSFIDGFVSTLNDNKRRQAAERKYALMQSHFDMFPKYPKDLSMYCEKHVFEHSYIFIGKVEKNHRAAVCGHCRRKFRLKKEIAAPGGFGNCPKCGIRAKYRGAWVNGLIEEKAKICIAHKSVCGQIIIRWIEVIRMFPGTEYRYRYEFDDYYRTLYLNGVIYSYKYMNIMGYGSWDWYRKKNDTINDEKTFIYTPNLTEVFGTPYYHVDLKSGLENAGEISFTRLLDNLKTIPAAEYLFKSGLSTFTANMCAEDLYSGEDFTQTLGVSRQYLPMYQKYNIDVYEHKIVRASGTWVSDESFAKFRALKAERDDTGDIIGLLDDMSFERFVNYFTKQKSLLKRKMKFLLIQYNDYINMSQSLKVDLTKKSVRFPKNIKEAHDLIMGRYNQVKHAIEDENMRHAKEKLYEGMNEYANESYCIIFPQLRSDFITEGQSLNHCVGTDAYYKNHMTGTRMVFFVRKAAMPDKPYFTLEIDMRELRIRQLYGFGDVSPPSEVRKFAGEFLRRLLPSEILM